MSTMQVWDCRDKPRLLLLVRCVGCTQQYVFRAPQKGVENHGLSSIYGRGNASPWR